MAEWIFQMHENAQVNQSARAFRELIEKKPCRVRRKISGANSTSAKT
jgi:hypothetical protein